jgi:hypothetical protein
MKLKKTIQIIEYSNIALLIGLFIGVFALVAKSPDGKFLIFEMLFAIPFILTFFFRKVIVSVYLRKSKYPGAFYSVLDKLGLTHNLEIDLTDDLLNEIYKPSYSTNEYLRDNALNTEIGEKRISLSLPIISIGLGIFALLYLGQKVKFQNKPLLFVSIVVFIVLNFYLWTKGKKHKNDDAPVVRFTEKGLYLNSQMFDWKSIYDWSYQAGGKNESDKIIINYYGHEQNIEQTIANLSSMNADKIDFLLLMTHYKGKYG